MQELEHGAFKPWTAKQSIVLRKLRVLIRVWQKKMYGGETADAHCHSAAKCGFPLKASGSFLKAVADLISPLGSFFMMDRMRNNK